MTFREELIQAKRWKKEEAKTDSIAEYLASNNLSPEDFSQKSSPNKHHRSEEWRSVRKTHLVKQPKCAICGLKEISRLEVHHILPFCWFPELELKPNNLITLCEIGIDGCHFDFGHPLGTQSYNPQVVQHARILNRDFSKLEEVMELAKLAAISL